MITLCSLHHQRRCATSCESGPLAARAGAHVELLYSIASIDAKDMVKNMFLVFIIFTTFPHAINVFVYLFFLPRFRRSTLFSPAKTRAQQSQCLQHISKIVVFEVRFCFINLNFCFTRESQLGTTDSTFKQTNAI